MLEARNLRKVYGTQVAVEDLTLVAEPGQILGLLGPNGAGKSTTVSMLGGLLRPDHGEVRIDGQLLAESADPLKAKLGLVPQELALIDELSARANLEFFGALYGLSGKDLGRRVDENLELVHLFDRSRDRVQTFSGGMKRRLNLAAALLHEPLVLLLDEPTVGVDPQSRNAIFENLEYLRDQGKALIYTTHYMEEVERLCERIVILDHGQVIAEDDLAGLARRVPAREVLLVELEPLPEEQTLLALRGLPGISSVTADKAGLQVGLTDLAAGAVELLACLRDHGCTVTRIHSERPNLETVFLHLTGRTLRDA